MVTLRYRCVGCLSSSGTAPILQPRIIVGNATIMQHSLYGTKALETSFPFPYPILNDMNR